MERVGYAGVHNLILQPEATITAVRDLVDNNYQYRTAMLSLRAAKTILGNY